MTSTIVATISQLQQFLLNLIIFLIKNNDLLFSHSLPSHSSKFHCYPCFNHPPNIRYIPKKILHMSLANNIKLWPSSKLFMLLFHIN